MSDLPLPEAIDEGLLRAAVMAWHDPPTEWHDTFGDRMRWTLAVILAFRDESGNRAVWSAEEVAPLIDALDRIETLTAITIDVSRNPHGRLRAIRDGARAALARVRGPEPEGDSRA